MDNEAGMVSDSSKNVLPVHARQLVVNEINLNEISQHQKALTTGKAMCTAERYLDKMLQRRRP
jgi:hypothetical protein